ncbi:unnamed protein product [Oikopleura dioica]|uniref:Uncharacterized protein n=1 Tax=Oikopleura dioica TaxID=34765 RepID=E4YB00_OIKDI|nr:unnamed protein product [Oikopleura dioica]
MTFDKTKEPKTVATVSANATCGEDNADQYCTLYFNTCGTCIANGRDGHPVENVVDGTESFWMSPPLSRGEQNNKVTLTFDLKQPFHIAYVVIKYAISPRAKTWVLERSVDGENWDAWQYFSQDRSQCRTKFDKVPTADGEYSSNSDVICTDEYTEINPGQGGEVIVSLVNGRPSQDSFSTSNELQEFTRATKIRIRLLEVNTHYGHFMSAGDNDPKVFQRYFYAIKDVEIGGRCVCNGHADKCVEKDGEYHCECQHNTTGRNCDQCAANHVQKKWRAGTPGNTNECERCNCNGHTETCFYDEQVDANKQSMDLAMNYEGGGVCQNCGDNTEGNNCERCKAGFWRAHDAPLSDPCLPCDCEEAHSEGVCNPHTGQCNCSPNYGGKRCNTCAPKIFYYPKCDREFQCDECSEALLDRIFPETDKVTQTMTQLNNVITSKLTQTKFDTLAQGSDDIERSISLINEGMDLYNNHDAKMSFLQKEICGKDGELAHWISVFMATKAAFNNTIEEGNQLQQDFEQQAIRAETILNDFIDVKNMSPTEYERRMKEARREVQELQQIYASNVYLPLLNSAEAERDEAVDLLNVVKERFGGGETTGRCHSNHQPRDFYSDRLHPATKDNYKFTPGDINAIDSDGTYRPAPVEDLDYETLEYDASDDYSDDFEDDYSEDSFDIEDAVVPDVIDPEDYSDYTEDVYEAPKKIDPLGFELIDSPSTYENARCPTDKQLAIIPDENSRTIVEEILKGSNVKEAIVGLKAIASVPPESWKWESPRWRSIPVDMTMFAEPSNDPTKKCVTMTKRGFVAEKCTDELEHFVCLGKDIDQKWRFFIEKNTDGLNYNGAQFACNSSSIQGSPRIGAVIHIPKTFMIMKRFMEDQKPPVQKAWIGLRSHDAMADVRWRWANGMGWNSALLDAVDINTMNKDVVNDGKTCLAVSQNNGNVEWKAVRCEEPRPYLCGRNPPPNSYSPALSRSKRNLPVLVNSLRRVTRNSLDDLNAVQDRPQYSYTELAPNKNLIMVNDYRPGGDYPLTSNIVDQLECVDYITNKASNTHKKLSSLESRIHDAENINAETEIIVDKVEEDLADVLSDIQLINDVNQNIQDGFDANRDTEDLADSATDAIEDLEGYEDIDFQIPEIIERTEDLKDHDWPEIEKQVGDARLRAKVLHEKYLELLKIFSIADGACTYHDNGKVTCDDVPRDIPNSFQISLLLGMSLDVPGLQNLGPIVRKAAQNIKNAEEALENTDSQLSRFDGNRDMFTAPCDAGEFPDFTEFEKLNKTWHEIKEDIDFLELANLNDYTYTDEDIARLDAIGAKIKAVFDDLKDIYRGKTPSDIEEGDYANLWGLEGAVQFMKNPGCWYNDEVCEYNVDNQEERNKWFYKYKEIIDTAIANAEHTIESGDINNEMAAAKRIFDEDIKLDGNIADKVAESLSELDDQIMEIQHLIESTKSLLQRMPLEKTVQKLAASERISPTVGDLADSRFHFEIDANVRLHRANNNILSFGNADSYVTIDTENEYAIASFVNDNSEFELRSNTRMNQGHFYNIKFEKMGRRIELIVTCAQNDCGGGVSDIDDREDNRRRRRHGRRKRLTRRVSRAADQSTPSVMFLDPESAIWEDFNNDNKLIIGDYGDEAIYEGLQGELNGVHINGRMVFIWDIDIETMKPENKVFDHVTDALQEPAKCWADNNGKFRDQETQNRLDCPCLSGKSSYLEIEQKSIDFGYLSKIRGMLQYTEHGNADNYVIASLFGGNSYLLVEKRNTVLTLRIATGYGEDENGDQFIDLDFEYTAEWDYSPSTFDDISTIKFALQKKASTSEDKYEGKILQYSDLYRPSAEKLQALDNKFSFTIPKFQFDALKNDLDTVTMYFGGIPQYRLEPRMKKVLTRLGLIEDLGQSGVRVKSMPACFSRLNINSDDINKKEENRFVNVLDGSGIYQHNREPDNRDIRIQTGRNLESNTTIALPVQLETQRQIVGDKEFSFGLSIESVSDARIFKFSNGEIKVEDGNLVFEINSKSFLGGPIHATGDPSSTVLIIMEVVNGNTNLFILGEKADFSSVAAGEEADFSNMEMGGSAGGEAFEGVVLQPRLQNLQTSQKYLSNFKCKTPRPEKSRPRRQREEDNTYNCNRMQFNYYYEE